LWEEHDLPLANSGAYPVPMGYAPSGSFDRPDRKLLEHITLILAALADTTETELDTGRWTKSVAGRRGATEVTLTLPNVYEPDVAAATIRARGARASERMQAEIGRFLAGRDFANLDAVNAAIADEFGGRSVDDIESTASTPLDRAQDLVYEAHEALGRRRTILARQALAICADCADAYVLLAEDAAGPARSLPLYEAAVAAGERALGRERLETHSGDFWGRLDTRPYMRARVGLGSILVELERVDAAIAIFRGSLRFNPNDNQGVRYLLLLELVRARRDDDALVLLREYPDDAAAEWLYTWALVDYRNGRRREADAQVTRAVEANRHVPEALVSDPADWPPIGDSVMIGGEDEAIAYAEAFGDVWYETAGATEWLHGQIVKSRGVSRARRGRPARRPRV
jgi:tetratricopeptide (TPR) repeat protein